MEKKPEKDWDELRNDKVIGEILVEEVPYVTKGIKYQLYVMLNKELPEELLEDPDADVFDYSYKTGYELWKVERITEGQMPVDDRRFLIAINTVDPELYRTKFAGRPAYRICLMVEEDFEGYKCPSGYGYVKKNEVAFYSFEKWLNEEEYEVILGSARKVKLFPWEKPRVTGRIPLTKGMLKKASTKPVAGSMPAL